MIVVMVKVNVEKLLKQNKRSKYWLCNQMQITMHNLNKVILGQTKSISFKYIHDFCKYLNEVKLQYGLEFIGDKAFAGCFKLKHIINL